MENEALIGLAGAGIVLGLLSALRQAIPIPGRFTPLLAIAVGIGWNVGLKAAEIADSTYEFAAILGILSGLSASGLYSYGVKKATAGKGK